MNTIAPTIEADLEEWLAKQPVWLQHAAKALIKGGALGPIELAKLVEMAITEANTKLVLPDPPLHLGSLGATKG